MFWGDISGGFGVLRKWEPKINRPEGGERLVRPPAREWIYSSLKLDFSFTEIACLDFKIK